MIAFDNENEEMVELVATFKTHLSKLIDMLDTSSPNMVSLKRSLNSLPNSSLPDICAAIIRASQEEKLEILDAVDLNERFKKIVPLLVRQIEVSSASSITFNI